ncbi:MAG TPA: YggT family protein [Firmicutes bacterium]|nr:YggT family protein [Bacillota bacterium]
MHIVRFTYSLNLIVILLNTYIMFFVIRLFVPFRKQIIFNRLYKVIYYATEPVLRLFGHKKVTQYKHDLRALYVTVIFFSLYSFFWIFDNPEKSLFGGLVYMAASFVTYFFYLFTFIFIADFFILMRGPYAYGEFARVIHFVSDTIIAPWRKLFPRLSGKKRDYTPFIGLLGVVLLSAFIMTLLSGLLGDAVSFMENLGRGLEALVNMFMHIWVAMIILRALFSWFAVPRNNFFMENLIFLTEPVLIPLRRLFPPYKIGLDFTPLVAVALMVFTRWVLILVINFIF